MAQLPGAGNPKFKTGVADLVGAKSFLKKFQRMGLSDTAGKRLMSSLLLFIGEEAVAIEVRSPAPPARPIRKGPALSEPNLKAIGGVFP